MSRRSWPLPIPGPRWQPRRSCISLQKRRVWLFVALMAGFMVKVPVWPFHTWLPRAYGESPIGVTILLSALLAKLGTFGILRLVLPLTPDAAILYGLPVVGALAAFGIIYAAFCAYDQKDLKLMIAYSSVSHLGFLVLGLFAFNSEGLSGAVLHMVNHGLSIGGAVRAAGVPARSLPHHAGLAIRRVDAAIPELRGAGVRAGAGQYRLAGAQQLRQRDADARWPVRCRTIRASIHWGLAVVAAFGILLSAWYMLTMLQKVFFNPMKEPQPVVTEVPDVTRREFVRLRHSGGPVPAPGPLPSTRPRTRCAGTSSN